MKSVFTVPLVGAFALLSACSSVPESAAPTAEQVVSRHIEAGMEPSVAECVVGIGSQELTLAALLPDGERDQTEEALYEALFTSCEEASSFVRREPVRPETLAFEDEPFTKGDDPGLDRLWDSCEAGDGASCDRLWETAPVGSEYERFGVTCGERDQLLDCGEELTEESVDAIDAAADARAEANDEDGDPEDGDPDDGEPDGSQSDGSAPD